MGYYKTKREKFDVLASELKMERVSYEPQWHDVADYLLPYRRRFVVSDQNRGDRRNQLIIDGSATMAHRTFKSGMMSGSTSPARPWKRITTQDPDLGEFGPVKDWTYQVDQMLDLIFAKCGLYNTLPTFYGDMAGFATGAMSVEEHLEKVIHTRSFQPGSYWLGHDSWGMVNQWFRQYKMTVRQIVMTFGQQNEKTGAVDWSNISKHVKELWDDSQYNTWVEVCHVIAPNDDYDATSRNPFSRRKRFSSCYYEMGVAQDAAGYFHGSDDRLFLSESGYDHFPILVGPWELGEGDLYGIDCPAMMAVGDIKQLQYGEMKGGMAIDKMIDPPLVGPPELKNETVSVIPGRITYLSERDGQKGLRPMYQVDFRLGELEGKQEQIRRRIDRAFYSDLFLMLSMMETGQRTAAEIFERKEEKLVQLGPMLENVNNRVLDPLIDRTFEYMIKQNLVPRPPKELQGQPLKIEYVSIFAQAQKAIGLSSIERVTSYVGQVAKVYPDILDKIDWDQSVDEYAERSGAPPRIVVPDEVVRQKRAARAAAQAEAQQAALLEQYGKGAKALSETNTQDKNALTDIVRGMSQVA